MIKKLTKGYSVNVIDDDLDGRIEEELENEEYLIKLNNGEIIRKKLEYLLPNMI